MKNLGPLELDEIKALRFDFTSEVQAGVTLSTPSVTVEVLEGTDPAASSMLVGSPTVVGLEVVQKIQPGVAGCKYKFRALANDSTGLRHGISGELTVLPG